MIAVAVASDEIIARSSTRTRRASRSSAIHGRSTWTTSRRRGSCRTTIPVYYVDRDDPLAGSGRADRADGAGLPAGRWTRAPTSSNIRDNVITLLTPIVEVDGRDRVVDLYNWTKKNPGKRQAPPLVYWGKYVAHDNNRDAMGVTLKLTEHVLNTMVDWHATVLHDLHESAPYLYDNTVLAGAYNAWVDPLLTNEWHMARLEQRAGNDAHGHARRARPSAPGTTGRRAICSSSRRPTTASAGSTKPSATAAAPTRASGR